MEEISFLEKKKQICFSVEREFDKKLRNISFDKGMVKSEFMKKAIEYVVKNNIEIKWNKMKYSIAIFLKKCNNKIIK